MPFGLISAGLGLLQQGQAKKAAKRAAKAADPFAPNRGAFADILNQLYGLPTAADRKAQITKAKSQQGAPAPQQGAFAEDFLSNLPGLKFAIEQGTQAAQRQASASGMGRSGNLLAEIARQTTGLAQQRAGEEINRLMTLSGATTGAPGTSATVQAGAPTSLSGVGGFLGEMANLKRPASSTTGFGDFYSKYLG